MNALFKGFCVYQRKDSEIIIYRCFERLSDHVFFVQSADRVRLPIGTESLRQQEHQFLKLLLDASPEERGEGHPSIEVAIQSFNESFSPIPTF